MCKKTLNNKISYYQKKLKTSLEHYSSCSENSETECSECEDIEFIISILD